MVDSVYVISGAPDPNAGNPPAPTLADAVTAARTHAETAQVAAGVATTTMAATQAAATTATGAASAADVSAEAAADSAASAQAAASTSGINSATAQIAANSVATNTAITSTASVAAVAAAASAATDATATAADHVACDADASATAADRAATAALIAAISGGAVPNTGSEGQVLYWHSGIWGWRGLAAADISNLTTVRLDQFAAPTASVSWNSQKITNLLDPTSAQDAATKGYVDALKQGLSPKQSVKAATTAALPGNTYNNGSSGVGATLTGNSNGALAAIDGYTPSLNDDLLVKDEVAAANRGIYTVTQLGDGSHPYIVTRRTDADTSAKLVGAYVFVEAGTANLGAGFVNATATAITLGTTAITFTQFSGAGEIAAGTGLSKSGNTLSLPIVSLALGGSGADLSGQADGTLFKKSGSALVAAVANSDYLTTPQIIRSARTSNTVLAAADNGTLVEFTSGSFTQTFTAAATLGSKWSVILFNSGTGDVTLDPNASETIDGLTSFPMYPGESRLITCDGSAFHSLILSPYTKTFTAGATYTKPPGYRGHRAFAQGGGGAGGSGARYPAATAKSGGSGGGAGGAIEQIFPDAMVPASVTVTIGAGGAGGAVITADSTAGHDGSDGGATSFGSLLTVSGGIHGVAGSSSGASAGGAGGSAVGTTAATPVNYEGATSGPGSPGGLAIWGGAGGGGTNSGGTQGAGGSALFAAGGGGAGGSETSGNAFEAATAGGSSALRTAGSGGAAGTSSAGAPTVGTAGTNGSGGGGGGASQTAAAAAGGAGSLGGGGGGGGSSRNTFNSGAGGAGGDGFVTVRGE